MGITTDASPWGLGAVLHVDGIIVEALSCPLQELDLKRFHLNRGCASGQAVWEALAELVATRVWMHHWAGRPWNLAVRGDSKAALGAMGKLKSVRSQSLNAIARELSFDLATGTHRISVREHLPGKENDLADFLSRRF